MTKTGWRTDRLRGFGVLGVLLLLAIIAVIVFANYATNDVKTQETRRFQMSLSNPEDMLQRYYIEQTKSHSLDDESWERMLSIMSSDDLNWLAANRTSILALNSSAAGKQNLSPREQDYYALQYLLRLDRPSERPIIVNHKLDDTHTYGVAYVHPPNNIGQLHELHLIREAGEWKLRRFLGARDDPAILNALIAAKTQAGTALDADETEFKANPTAYIDKMRARFLNEAGLKP